MALTKYELIHTEGLKGVNFNGDNLLLADITDEIAEQLEGKTHILKKKTPVKAAAAQLAEGK